MARMDSSIWKKLSSKSVSLIRRAIFEFYQAFLRPKSEIEDNRRKEFILNVIIVGVIALMLSLNGLVIYSMILDGPNYNGIPLVILVAATLLFLVLYFLSRLGYYAWSSYILIAVYLAGAVYGAYRWGTDLPSSLLAYALLIIISSVLINTRFALIIGIFISGITLFMGYHQSDLEALPVDHWKRRTMLMGDAVEYSILLLFILGVSGLSNREIEKSLTRARKSEAELKQEKDFLEIKVEERTKELKQLQLEKMSQMERFVEFGKLASGFFHDLANPLTALSISVKQLKETSAERVHGAETHLEQAFAASNRMENFLQAAKKQLQASEQNREFELNQAIEDVLQVLSYKARKAKVQVNFEASQKLVSYGDAIKFYQVALNLVSNAIESFDESPPQRERKINIVLGQTENKLKLSVQDNGPGIQPRDLENIFYPFFTTKQAAGGLGLGLSSTREIIMNSLKGTIDVQSGPNGTVFNVQIPLNKN